MALKFDDKPGYDGGDQQQFNPSLSTSEEGAQGKESQNPANKIQEGLQNILSNESNPDVGGGNKTSANGAEDRLSNLASQASDVVGKGFTSAASTATPVGKAAKLASLLKSKKSKRNAGIVGIGGTIGGLLMFFLSIIGPASFLEHVRSIGLDRMNEFQTEQSIRYRRSKLARFNDIFSRDGRRGGAIIAEMQANGYRFSFDQNDRNKIRGITTPGGKASVFGAGAGAEIEAFIDSKHPFRSSRWKTKRMQAFYKRYGIPNSKSPTVKANNALEDPKLEINRGLASGSNGRGTSLERSADVSDNRSVDENGEIIEEDLVDDEGRSVVSSEDRAEGVEELGGDKDNKYREVREELINKGTPINEIDSDLARTLNGIDNPIDELTLSSVNRAAKSGSVISLATLRSFGAADIADRVCTIKNGLRAAVTGARISRALGLQNLATLAVVLPSDAARVGLGQDSRLIQEVASRFQIPDSAGNAFAQSPLISYATTGRFDKSQNEDLKSSYSVDGRLSGVLRGIQDFTDKIPGTSENSCGFWQNPATQIGLGAIEIGAAIFSFGSSTGATTAAKLTVKEGVQEIIQRISKKQIAKSLIKTAAVELTFEGIMLIGRLYADKALALPVTGQEQGAQFTSMSFTGIGVLHKSRNLQAGQIPVTADVYGPALAKFEQEKQEEIRSQSFYARIFDTKNPHSLAYTHLHKIPHTPEVATHNLASAFMKAPATILNTPGETSKAIAGVISPKAYAQGDSIAFDTLVTEGNNSGIRLATDPGGNVLTAIPDNILNIDEIANRDYLIEQGHVSSSDPYEPISDTFKGHLDNCVYTVDTISMIEGGDINKAEEDCMARGNEANLVRRFKAHLAYVDFLDGISGDFLPGELGGSGSGSGASTVSAPGLNGYTVPCTGEPRQVVRINSPAAEHADWTGIPDSGTIGTGSGGDPINVYIREACDTSNPRTVLIVSSVHGSENGGQFVGHELLYNADLPDDVRIIVVPEVNKTGITDRRNGGAQRGQYYNNGRVNANAVNLNRNNDYRWESMNRAQNTSTSGAYASNYRGAGPASKPETKALNDFILSLGNIDLSLHYHDNLNYVAAAVKSDFVPLARRYGQVSGLPVGNSGGPVVSQRGSLDGWQAENTEGAVLLVELSADLSQPAIDRNVEAIKAILVEGI